jgi:nucleotide-binding universal stress UspA family protein
MPAVPLDHANWLTREHGQARLSALANQLKAQGIRVIWSIVEGDPAHSIIEYEAKHNIDLVAMASHGRTGLTRALLGSVTDTVLREGGRPVLVIRAKEPA